MGLKLDRVVFGDCSLHDVDFSEAPLRQARLESAHGHAIDANDNMIGGMRVALPKAVSLLSSLGMELVELMEPPP